MAIQEQYIFCFDNLGQDKEISLDKREKILELCNFYKNCWESRQKAILTANIEAVINYNDNNVVPEILEQLAQDE